MQISTEEAGLRARLEQLVAEHSQARLARDTGVTPSNVSRYLAGMRVPAEFCMRLVEKLGVNPAWLLTGEGATYLADVDVAGGVQARDMLELVRAMEAVARVRLGALSGKPDRKLLRELSDNIEAFEKLRAQLHLRTAGFLKDLLDQLHAAIEAREMPKADFLCNAARQAGRFCDDDLLLRRLDHYEAHLLSVQRKDESALKLQHKAIARYLALAEPDLMAMHEINAHAVYLLRVGRIEDARRTARAARELALDLEATPEFQLLRMSEGMALMLLGRLREGGPLVIDAANRLGPPELEYYAAELATAELFMGLSDPASKLAQHKQWLRDGREEAVGASVTAVISFCFWEGNPRVIRDALALYTGSAAVRGRVSPFLAEYAELYCGVLEGKGGGVREFLKSEAHRARIEAESPVDRFRGHATACDLALAAGQEKLAREEWEATQALLQGLGRRYQIPVLQLGLHHRNGLELFEKAKGKAAEPATQARQFFQQQFKEGYACFRGLGDND
ncbi:MAG: hypothetical protein ICCCNLDF_01957 [Planctomycetes bacterium]|nr:hypothetical protein [Planctomycetota bacterium]